MPDSKSVKKKGPGGKHTWELLGLLLLLGGSGPAHAGPEEPERPWVHLRPEVVDGAWTVQADPKERDVLRVVSRHAPAEPGERRHEVLVLFTVPLPAYDWVLNQMLTVFRDKKFPVSLTLVRFEGDEAKGQRVLSQAEAGRFELIIAMGSDSAQYLYTRFGDRPTPVVALCKEPELWLGFDDRARTRVRPANFSFVSLTVPPRVQLIYLEELLGSLRSLTVMYDRQNTSAVKTQVEPLRRLASAKGIRVLDVAVDGPERAREALAEQVPAAARAMLEEDPEASHSLFLISTSTAVFEQLETINLYSGNIPVLSSTPESVRPGDDSAVMSIGVRFESAGHMAALHTVGILRRKVTPSQLGVGVVSPPDLAINFRRARQIGLRIPFRFVEQANLIYGPKGQVVRQEGQHVPQALER